MAHKSVTEFEAMGAMHLATHTHTHLKLQLMSIFLLNKLGSETSLLNISQTYIVQESVTEFEATGAMHLVTHTPKGGTKVEFLFKKLVS